jgi:hypothetical protein
MDIQIILVPYVPAFSSAIAFSRALRPLRMTSS